MARVVVPQSAISADRSPQNSTESGGKMADSERSHEMPVESAESGTVPSKKERTPSSDEDAQETGVVSEILAEENAARSQALMAAAAAERERRDAELLVDVEQKLANHRLSKADIERQDFDDLIKSLDLINQIIADPDSYFKLPGFKLWIFSISQTTDVKRILLDRKQLIISRFRDLERVSIVGNLRTEIVSLADTEKRSQLLRLLDQFEQKQRMVAESADVEKKRMELRIAEQRAGNEMRLEGLERKRRLVLELLQRESAATIIGGGALIVIILTLLICAVMGKDTIPVLSNGFLLILGYFFGQNSSFSQNSNRGPRSSR